MRHSHSRLVLSNARKRAAEAKAKETEAKRVRLSHEENEAARIAGGRSTQPQGQQKPQQPSDISREDEVNAANEVATTRRAQRAAEAAAEEEAGNLDALAESLVPSDPMQRWTKNLWTLYSFNQKAAVQTLQTTQSGRARLLLERIHTTLNLDDDYWKYDLILRLNETFRNVRLVQAQAYYLSKVQRNIETAPGLDPLLQTRTWIRSCCTKSPSRSRQGGLLRKPPLHRRSTRTKMTWRCLTGRDRSVDFGAADWSTAMRRGRVLIAIFRT